MYQVQIRNVRGFGQWGGQSLGWAWQPAVAGTLNQTGFSDALASRTETREEAEAIEAYVLETLVAEGIESDEAGSNGHGYEVRIAEVE